MRQEERKAREERKASRAAAARWGPWSRGRGPEPDLIESETLSWSGWAQRRGGLSAGRASPAGEETCAAAAR